MPRHAPSSDADLARSRLSALRLREPAPAWVPEQAPRPEPSGFDVAPPPVDPPAGGPAQGMSLGDRLGLWAQELRLAPSGAAVAALAAVCIAGVVLVGVLTLHGRGHPVPSTPAPPPPPPPSPSAATIVVDVGGRVRHPGLVTLPPGSRVADALRAAGGALRAADLLTVNLAARVSDGQLLLIGVRGAAATAGAADTADQPVDLNTATLEQLEALPGVGPVLGQRIIDWREAHNGFGSVDELQDVPGIGDRKFADLQSLVSV